MTSTATISTTSSVLDVERIRADFPLLQRVVNGYPLVYLDNAATSQKPTAVIRAIDDYYQMHNANVHRGVYTLSEEATEAYEGAQRDGGYQPGSLRLGRRERGQG